MLKIVAGNFEKIKEEMKEAQTVRVHKLSTLNKSFSGHRLDDAIRRNDFLKNMYSSSKVLPVRVGGITINYKLLSSFMKKIKRFQSSTSVIDGALVVRYWKTGRVNEGRGMLQLHDLSEYFAEFQHIPEAVLLDAEA